jgi:NAD(P)H-flavin reductase
VPILFKQYDNGKFTDSIVKTPVKSLFLSSPKGEGLQFSQLKPGKVVIVAGGTGIYPFADLIDLLFKDEIMKQEPNLTEAVL